MTVGTRESPWDVAHVRPALTAPALGSLLIGMVTLFSFPVAAESPTAGGLRSLPDAMQSEGILACWPQQPKPGQRSRDFRSLAPLLVFPFAPWRAEVPSAESHQHRKALPGLRMADGRLP